MNEQTAVLETVAYDSNTAVAVKAAAATALIGAALWSAAKKAKQVWEQKRAEKAAEATQQNPAE